MSCFQDIRQYVRDKKHWVYRNIYYRLKPRAFYLSPRLMASMWYAYNTGELPNLRHPQNVNELWMSINLRAMKDAKARALRIQCADKYAVRQYVIDKGFADVLNECYGVYNSFDEIDFAKLPNQFVLKLTTACGKNFICKDKTDLNIEELRKMVDKWYDDVKDFGLRTAEWHYVEIKPRLVVEKYLSQLGESSLVDYKIHCFNGNIRHIETISDRNFFTGSFNCDSYSTDWKRTDDILPQYHIPRRKLPEPQHYDYMKKVAEALSAEFEYVRVDMYEIDGKPIFGELTFTPAGCIEYSYTPDSLTDMCRFYFNTSKR